ncbi:Arc family DNA-binding protein [Serratia marcescens]|nr:Arc family DNA-binding protein [Serratia marcescens]
MKGMRNIAPTGIRIPQEIKDALKERAAREGRSLNSEIIRILSASVKG